MLKRGRKSAELAVIIPGDFGKRPEPPDDLTPRQAEIWRLMVASEPQSYFASEAVRGLLADYCRHRETASTISATIEKFKSDWLKEADGVKRYKALLQMRDIETRACSSLATKLRLTNQARYTPQAAGTATRNAATGPRPWDE